MTKEEGWNDNVPSQDVTKFLVCFLLSTYLWHGCRWGA